MREIEVEIENRLGGAERVVLHVSPHSVYVTLEERDARNLVNERVGVSPHAITRLIQELSGLFSAVDLLAWGMDGGTLRERARRAPHLNPTTVAELRTVLSRLDGSTPLGESRLIEQGGKLYEVFDHLTLHVARAGHADGYRGELLEGGEYHAPTTKLADHREVLVLGRSKLCDHCTSVGGRSPR